LTVTNKGNVPATAVALTDSLPANMTLSDANWTAAGQIATLNTPIAGPIAPGATASVNITVKIAQTFTGTSLTNYAQIQSAKDDKGNVNPKDPNSTPGNGFNNGEDDASNVPIVINKQFGSIGDFVFLDKDGSNTQTAGDTPIAGVKVYLLDATGAKIDSTTTGTDGKYVFNNLPAGTYSVQFVAPTGQNFVTANSGTDDTKDSDAGTDGKTGTYTIDTTKPVGDPARDITSVDAGLKAILGSIGDFVFVDNDGSGTQTAGDEPVVGVKVYLLNAAGVKIDSTVTGTDGKYLFSNLPLGTYSVQFVAPAGQTFVTPNQGGDPTKDSDAGTGGKTGAITLTATTPNVTTVDAGLKPATGSIGDFVFLDKDGSNTQTAGDVPIKDVVVYLLDATGAKIDSTTTGADGKYLFSNLPAGTYSVQFVAPVGQNFVTATQGGDPTKDSDAGTNGKTGTYTIDTTKPVGDPARDITSVDAGLKASICEKPILTVKTPVCDGSTTYSISFYSSSSNVTTSAGVVSGSMITKIPVGTDVIVTAITSDGCSSTLTVVSPVSCKTVSPCKLPTLSVGQPLCNDITIQYRSL
jgi:hypothetical protein